MIKVVVDTTATFVDVMMRTSDWVQLLTLCRNQRLELVIPDVVVRETVRHWHEEAAEALRLANARLEGIPKLRRRLEGLGLDASELPRSTGVTTAPDPDAFERATRARLRLVGAKIASVPAVVSVESILLRDLERRKPFDSRGRGFRDVLVWETVKGVVAGSSGGDAVYFVTGNSEDFCDPDGELAAELVAECDAVAPQVRVVRFGDLEALMASRQLRPIVDTLTRSGEDLDSIFVRSSVQGGGAVPTDSVDDEGDEVPTISSVVREAVLGAAEELVNNEVALGYEESAFNDPLSSLVSSSVEGLSVSSIEPDESSFDWQTYETYDETTFLIRAEIVAKVSLLGFAHKSDAIDSDEFDVIDGDWNDHMSLVSVSARARLVFRIRVEQGQDFVEECELEEVEPIEESGGPS